MGRKIVFNLLEGTGTALAPATGWLSIRPTNEYANGNFLVVATTTEERVRNGVVTFPDVQPTPDADPNTDKYPWAYIFTFRDSNGYSKSWNALVPAGTGDLQGSQLVQVVADDVHYNIMQGPPGPAGDGLYVYGAYPTFAALQEAQPNPKRGDSFLVGSKLYVWDGTSWGASADLQGAKGDKGDKGATGDRGATGLTGLKGNTGVTPNINAIANTGAPGSTAAVAQFGTPEAPVITFTIPRGDQGLQGVQGEKGDRGDTGLPGAGVPTGGTLGEVIFSTGDGTTNWDFPVNLVENATPTVRGIMSAYDKSKIDSFVSVKDFGAKGDGIADDSDAIMQALSGKGRAVFFPAGTYRITRTMYVNSNTEIYGAGRDLVKIKMSDTAPIDVWVFTNADRTNGNENIYIHDLTADWNAQRFGAGNPTASGGSNSSAICFGNVRNSAIRRVRAMGAGLHGIDITCASVAYPYTGDGSPNAAGPSRYVWVDECETFDFGDDGITTHHSEYLFISNSFSHSPRNRTNNNGIEIDDGSRHVFLTNNTTWNCYAGIEIKAHDTASAPSDVHIVGHMSVSDCRAYNWRHIGHHSGAEPISKTAFDITASNLVALYPSNRMGYQGDTSPRALCINAYQRVSVTNFTAIGDHTYDYGSQPASVVQYRSAGVSLNGFHSSGFTSASCDLAVGSATGPVFISGMMVRDSAPRALWLSATGTGYVSIRASHLMGTGTANGALYALDAGYKTLKSEWYAGEDVITSGYTAPIRFSNTNYQDMASYLRGASSLPGGTTSMKQLTGETSYYLSTTQFAGMGTDRPNGAVGAFVLENSPGTVNGLGIIQKITRISTGDTVQYRRYLDVNSASASTWRLVTETSIAYSTT